nr:ImmA/IrrE family metallo-endopeptidase [uncultured Clostridium sp.]
MINAPDYHVATNAAYELLIEQDVLELPVNLSKLIYLRRQNTHLMTYSQMAARFSMTVSDYKDLVPSELGFTMKMGNRNYILYNEEKGYCTNRFTIAHEIGHIMLGHKTDDSVAEREANCFARNLLCPVPVINSFNITDIYDYMGWFHISDLMAENCIKNISSDRYYIKDRLYSIVDDLIYTYMTGESLVSAYGYSYYN